MLYSPEGRSLDIVFCDERGIYRYFDVEPEEWTAFKQAASKAAYLDTSFAGRHPRYERLETQPATLVASLAASVVAAPKEHPEENVWGFYAAAA